MPNQDTLKRAYHFLEIALKYEAEGKEPMLIERAFKQAVKLEDEAFAG